MPWLWSIASIEKRSNTLESQLRSDHSGPDTQHIHIIVLDSLPSRVSVMAQRGTNARKFIGGDTHSDSAATHQDASIHSPRENFQRPPSRQNRGNHMARMNAFRSRSRQSLFAKQGNDVMLQSKTGVVTTDSVTKRRGGLMTSQTRGVRASLGIQDYAMRVFADGRLEQTLLFLEVNENPPSTDPHSPTVYPRQPWSLRLNPAERLKNARQQKKLSEICVGPQSRR